MATVTAPPTAAPEQPRAQTARPPQATPEPVAPADGFQPTWEHFGNRGDRIALIFWLISFAAMALMILLDPLLHLLR
jgi:hypothetical protein